MRLPDKGLYKQCAYCPRKFTREEHLRRHERSHTGEKPFKCHKCNRRYGRSDVLARHLQTHPSRLASKAQSTAPASNRPKKQASLESGANQSKQNLNFNFPSPDLSSPTPAAAFAHPPQFPGVNNSIYPIENGPFLMTPATPVLCTPAPNSQRNITDDHRQEPSIVAALPAVGVEHSPGFCHGTSDESSTTVAGEVTNAQRAGTSSSLGHVARSQPGPVVFPNNQDLPEQQQEQQQQSPAVQVVDQIPLLTQPRSVDQDFSIFDADFDGYNYPSQGILDDFNLIACWTSEPTPPGATEEAAVKPGMLFSENQVQQLRPLWRGQRAVPGVRVSSSLWRSVVHHQADNIFARRKLPENYQAGSDRGDCGTDNWGVDNICRTAMIDFCKELEGGIRVDGLPAFTPIASYNTEHEQAIPGSLTDDFPGIELVEASIDVFFQLNHLPFLHKATFDARAVPVSLLLPILLIGFSSLYPERSKSFVLRCMQVYLGFHPLPSPARLR